MESSLTDDAAPGSFLITAGRAAGSPHPPTLRHPAQPDHQEQRFSIGPADAKRRRQKVTYFARIEVCGGKKHFVADRDPFDDPENAPRRRAPYPPGAQALCDSGKTASIMIQSRQLTLRVTDR
jgi:hypothetical protein